MGRRELAEHREQLREGKRWLEGMLAKTEKLLQMVESKIAVTSDSPTTATPASATSAAPPPAAATGRNQSDDWEFEERERLRQKEFQRLEEEAQRDRQEKERREKERQQDRPRPSPTATQAERERADRTVPERERDNLQALYDRDTFRGRTLARDKADLERRDLIMGSRRVGNASPPATNGRPTVPAIGSERSALASERAALSERPSHGTHSPHDERRPNNGSAAGSNNGTVGSGPKANPWESEPGPALGSVALPRREPVSGRLGRGLWAFDTRS